MTKWTISTLGKVSSVITGPFGSQLHKSDYVDSGIPLIMPQNIGERTVNFDGISFVSQKDADRLKRYKVNENDIVYSRRGDVEKHAFINNELAGALCGTGCLRVRFTTNDIYPEFISLYLNRPESKKWIRQHAVGSSMPNLNTGILEDIPISYPKKEEQIALTILLRNIDQKIQINNRINNELVAMVKNIYDYWFVQFDFPNTEGKPYRSSDGEMVWNEQLKKEIPKGWSDAALYTFIKEKKGGDWGNEQITGNYTEQVICIRGADLQGLLGKQILNAPMRYILKNNMDKALSDGDIIVEISGGSPIQSTGRVCYINKEVLSRFDIPIITSNFCKSFSLIDKNWQYWFYVLWEKLYSAGVFFKYEGKTTGIKNLLFDMLCSDYRTIYPDENIAWKYNDFVKPIFKDIQKKNMENQELTKLRNWLLPMLMNGQATVE